MARRIRTKVRKHKMPRRTKRFGMTKTVAKKLHSRAMRKARRTNKRYRSSGNININWAAFKELTWKQWIGLLTFLAVLIIAVMLWIINN